MNVHIFNKQWISAKIPKMRHIDTTMRPTFCLAASMRPDCATWRIAQTHRQKRCIGQLWVQLVMLAIWPNKWPVTMKTWQLRTANAYWCQVWPVHNYIDFKNLCWRFKQQDICLSYPSKWPEASFIDKILGIEKVRWLQILNGWGEEVKRRDWTFC